MTGERQHGADPLTLLGALGSVLDRLDLGVVVQSADGAIVDANVAAERLLGLTRRQLLGRDSYDPRWRAVGEDGDPMPGDRHPSMRALATGEEVRDALLGIEVPGERLRWLSVSAFPLRTDPGDPRSELAGVAAVFRDATEVTRSDQALRTWERRYRLAAELSPVGVAILGWDGRVIRANREFQRLFERTEQALQRQPWWRVLPLTDLPSVLPLSLAMGNRDVEEATVEVRLDTERPRYVRVHCRVLATEAPPEIVVVADDVTADVQRRARLEQRADHDPLTGLLHMGSLLERAGEDGGDERRTAALFVDVDGFKDVNDTHGHEVGNVVLADLAERLTRRVRSDDLVARAGGDEFVVLLRGVGDDGVARAIAERIVTSARVPVSTPAGPVTATVSVGLALAPSGTPTPVGELLRRADRAMYAAKSGGRDRVVVDGDGS